MLNDPYTLSPDRGAEPELGGQSDARGAAARDIAPELDGYWVGAFAMAHAQLAHRAAQQRAAGLRLRPAVPLRRADERRLVAVSRRWPRPWRTGGNVATMGLGGRYFNRVPRGAGRAHRAQARHRTQRADPRAAATTPSRPTPPPTTGARYRATMAQQGDPGYKATSVLLGESGLALALDRDTLLRPARRADPGGRDGRRAAGPASRLPASSLDVDQLA